MTKPRLCYVIADGGRARFVERDEQGAYRTVLSFVAAELHKRSRDLGRDRPARVKESANVARHAVEPRRDLHEAAKEDFVALVAEKIEAEHGRGQFDSIVLVAPPGVLTELKQKLSKPIAALVIKDLQKDLTKVPDHDLAEHLARRWASAHHSGPGLSLTPLSLDEGGEGRIVLNSHEHRPDHFDGVHSPFAGGAAAVRGHRPRGFTGWHVGGSAVRLLPRPLRPSN